MTQISIAIINVLERIEWAKSLVSSLNYPVRVMTDFNHNGMWWNAKRSWQVYDTNATHHLVLQDDVKVCRNFIRYLYQIVEVKPTQCLTFYQGLWATSFCRKALLQNKHLIQLTRIGTAQAVLLPVNLIDSFLQFDLTHCHQIGKSDDTRLGWWEDAFGVETWLSVPELVSHIGKNQSVLGHHVNNIPDKYFKDNLLSMDDPDWSLGADQKNPYPYPKWHLPIIENIKKEIWIT